MSKLKQGWQVAGHSRVWHYFIDYDKDRGYSLCGFYRLWNTDCKEKKINEYSCFCKTCAKLAKKYYAKDRKIFE